MTWVELQTGWCNRCGREFKAVEPKSLCPPCYLPNLAIYPNHPEILVGDASGC